MERVKTETVPVAALGDDFLEVIYNTLMENIHPTDIKEYRKMIINFSADEVRRNYVLNPNEAMTKMAEEFDLFKTKLIQLIFTFAPKTLDLETAIIKTYY